MKQAFPIREITPENAEFPGLLKNIPSSPKKLYVRGTLPPLGMPLIAVVGTRDCTPYGQFVTEEITRHLAEQGVGIVSGLALGIDGIAHRTALEVKGYTIAVLGTGIDTPTISPPAHQHLAEQILVAGGAIVSEYTPKEKATSYSFQARNRIIAGLSHGTLVTEAPQKSGSLITAKHAMDDNRDLFVVPHPITNEQGVGNNNYLKLGAIPVTSYVDILKHLGLEEKEPGEQAEIILDPTAQKIISLLGRQPLYIDTIIKESKLSSQVVTATLTMLELKRLVKNLGGLNYIKR